MELGSLLRLLRRGGQGFGSVSLSLEVCSYGSLGKSEPSDAGGGIGQVRFSGMTVLSLVKWCQS